MVTAHKFITLFTCSFFPFSELFNMNGVMNGGRACNNLPVGADMCCWFDLVNNSTLVKHDHGSLPGNVTEEPRNPHTLKEIIALKALGGLAVGGILKATGLAGLAGVAGAGCKSIFGFSLFLFVFLNP